VAYFFPADKKEQFCMKRFGLQKLDKLKSKKEFQNVYEKGHSVVDSMAVFYVLPGENEKLKIGFAVGKKAGDAVRRNRAKRMMREVFRHHKEELVLGTCLIWVARKRLVEADYKTFERVFLRLAKRAALLR
jgi:ribonuclease P protein component